MADDDNPLALGPARLRSLQQSADAVAALAHSMGIVPPERVTGEFALALRHQLERRRDAVLSAVLAPGGQQGCSGG